MVTAQNDRTEVFMTEQGRLAGKAALITAAGQGIGKPINRSIAKEAVFLIGVPLGLVGKTDRRVHR